MIQPRTVQVDAESGAAYVTYAVGIVAGTIEVWDYGQVAADVDDKDTILGIELLGLDAETIGHARNYATQHGLAFPESFEGAA